jgi:hypothetical protein
MDSKFKDDWLLVLTRTKETIQNKYINGFSDREFLYLTPFISLYILPFEILSSIGELFTESILENLPEYISNIVKNNDIAILYLKSLDIFILNGMVAYIKTHPTNLKSKLDRFVRNMILIVFQDLENMEDPISKIYKLYWNSCSIIQKQWKICISNPNFYICKKRLMQEYNSLQGIANPKTS